MQWKTFVNGQQYLYKKSVRPMSRPRSNHPIVLTADERQIIESMLLDPETRKRRIKRLKAVLLMADGVEPTEAAALLRVSGATVLQWRKILATGGIALLLPPRRPTPARRYGPEIADKILALVATPPPPGVRWWTAKLIAAQLTGVPWHYVSAFLRRRCIDPRASRRTRYRY